MSLMKFDGLASTNLTIAKYLAKTNEVYYIEQPYTISDFFRLKKKSTQYQLRKKGLRFFDDGLLEDKLDGVNLLVSLPIFPINFLPEGKIYSFFNRINERIILSRIKKVIKKKGIENYIYINSYNFRCPTLFKTLEPDLNIYHCVDPIVGDYNTKHGFNAERIIVENADVIICTSRALYEEKKKQNSNTYFVPNGADIGSSISSINNLTAHPSLQNIKKPIVGYIGAIERRIDYDLIKNVTDQNPHVSFVFVGPQHPEHIPDWFYNTHNIHVIQPIPYDEVAPMIYGFDVCMIPFKKDDISNTIFPLKLFEYLGLGKPVICTDFNMDLAEFSGNEVVSYVEDSTSFSNAINQYIINNDLHLKDKRIQIALQNTWQDRVNRISEILAENLNGKF